MEHVLHALTTLTLAFHPDGTSTGRYSRRQRRGIEAAKLWGDVYKGRPPSIDPARVKELRAEGLGPAAIAKTMGIGQASVYQALAA